jgi:glutathione S-transferase
MRARVCIYLCYVCMHTLNLIICTALNLKEIPYEIKPISLVKGGGEHHSNEFREINPMEQVPALHIDNHTLIESVNKILYLFT